MKVGLVIPIFNRPQYVAKCFASLEKLTVRPYMIVIVDDASTEQLPLLNLSHKLIKHEKNTGIRGSITTGIEYLFKQKCDIVINLDSDAIVKPDFIERLTELYLNYDKKYIASGFNCITKTNPNISKGYYCVQKAFANGINMCFNRQQYEKYIKPSLAKVGNWDYNTSLACQADNLPFIVTTPSVVQHIGIESSMGHVGGDFAQDFKQLSLPDVTLFGIDSHDITGIERAAMISSRNIDFGATKIITDDYFATYRDRRKGYSRFMLKELNKHFNTSHVLTIHADGYVVNWEAWDDSFLQFDFIGATWGYKDNMNVGNGGFSLRSKKLCQILADADIPDELMHPEDHCICRTYRKSLEEHGIKFAPEEVANRFSIEGYGAGAFEGGNRYGGQFGFHSVHVDFNGSAIPEQDRLIIARQNVVSSQRRLNQVKR
jgi:glycosyltransferase involved in cell wall biosynthesis